MRVTHASERPARPSDELHVVFLVRSFGFPNGLANTNRVRLLGRALVEQGATVHVLCTRVSELPGRVRNTAARGTADGISFEYTTGTTVRSASFAARRLREARGYGGAIRRLVALRRRRRLDCVYLWSGARSWRIAPWLLVKLLNTLRVPVIVELNEHPWRAPRLPAVLGTRLSLLHGVSGAVAISAYLAAWASREAKDARRGPLPILEVPILVDAGEQHPTEYNAASEHLIYAASPGYDAALAFILETMGSVWRRHPNCKLVVTGGTRAPSSTSDSGNSSSPGADPRIEYVGYVARDTYLQLLAQARAALIPLFADQRSEARFPTKIGEYLAAARPVVTTHVGELDRYLEDGETAYLSKPGDAAAYAAQIVAALDDPERAATIGQAGRRIAEEQLHYALHGARLRAFFAAVARDTRAGSGDVR
jgi:glycosyltransferase involved in cell wall biosynthesis